jgi:hypothetical protein
MMSFVILTSKVNVIKHICVPDGGEKISRIVLTWLAYYRQYGWNIPLQMVFPFQTLNAQMH